MKISVIIPIYNVGDFLSKCIESLTNQNYNDYELILVNDGSTDNSQEICEYYQERFDNIKLINQKNQGSGIARNTGLKVASGEYVFFCDPDDYITGEFFQKVKEITFSQPDIAIFGYWDEYQEKDNIKTVSLTFEKEKELNQESFREEFCKLFKKNVMYTLWNKVYKKSFLDKFNFTFENAVMGQDTRFNLDVYKEVSTVKIVPDQYYHYIQSRPGSSTSKYRNNRINLKLEELDKLKKLIVEFGITDEDCTKKVKSNILIDSCNHIADSELPLKEKYKKINTILNIEEFNNIFCENENINFLYVFLLSKKLVGAYIALRKIYSRVGVNIKLISKNKIVVVQ